ncbi:MAG: hypothetical protein B7Z78_01165 [Rhodospirillales bacterium 20-60-12]|nr:MAG: hypothetical protein B7Z78_01165 [Rhodospirillales bacterium 20-60-12]HQT66919.1 hypothetical protein [Acetobacteraceae bacterium]HQU01225.1 hypothetical protein [Acetobacteraceae bacterium]
MSESLVSGSSLAGTGAAPRWRLALAIVVLGAAIGGFYAGAAPHTPVRCDPHYVTLIRFISLVKTSLAAGIVAGLAWRLGSAVNWGAAILYLLAAGSMAAGPGLIWHMQHIAAGALCFHGGIALGVATMLIVDRAGWVAVLSARLQRARRSI